jgi:S-adenosylmethionine decarboxylase
MSNQDPKPYGLLFALDGYGASPIACGDADLLLRALRELPLLIGMRPLGEPHVVQVDEPGSAGLSGFTFIMESHISIHTYTERGFVTADIYSCKEFNTLVADRYLCSLFKIGSAERTIIPRGLHFNAKYSSQSMRSVRR